jgi:hypothetical protein
VQEELAEIRADFDRRMSAMIIALKELRKDVVARRRAAKD